MSAGAMARQAMIAAQPESVLALKEIWRTYPAISAACTLAGKLAGIEAAKAGANPICAAYVAQGYSLPNGATWPEVERARAKWDTAAHLAPIACAPGATAWGVPLIEGRYLLHPGNIRAEA